MKKVTLFYQRFKKIGDTDQLGFSERLRAELCNMFVLISIHALSLHLLFNTIGPREPKAYLTTSIWLSVSLITLWLNSRRHFLAGKLFLVSASLVCAAIWHVLNGWAIRLEPMYMLLVLSSCFFFRKNLAIFMSILIGVVYAVVAAIILNYPSPWQDEIIPSAPIMYFLFSTVAAFILTGSVLLENAKFNRLLSQQNELLKWKNKEFENFNFILAHDLKTPVRHLLSFSKILETNIAKPDHKQTSESLGFVVKAADKLNAMIDDIGQYALIDKYAQETPADVDINQVIQKIETHLKADFPNRQIQLSYQNLPSLRCSPFNIKLLFKSLIYNSIIYNKQPIVKITIDHHITEDQYAISIKDNGIGIKAENYEYIFQHFKRVEPGFRENSSGLGLSLSKKIVELLHGNLSVQSEIGQGSTFTITVPIHPETVAL